MEVYKKNRLLGCAGTGFCQVVEESLEEATCRVFLYIYSLPNWLSMVSIATLRTHLAK